MEMIDLTSMNLMVCEKLKTLNSQAGIVKFK